MINKQKLWFLTLFSLILVLSVYYITMPGDVLNSNEINASPVVNITEEDSLSVLREYSDEQMLKEIQDLKLILTNVNSSIEDKNSAYEKLQIIENNKGKETKLENKIKDKYNLDAFIKIKDNNVKVTINSNNHNYELANNIIRSIQEEFENKMYISVKFQ